MKNKIKNKIIRNIIIFILVLSILPLASCMQDFTYYENETLNFSLINLDYQGDFFHADPWFRYGDYSLEACIEKLIGNDDSYHFTIKEFYLDCDEFSFYNFIKYIRGNNLELILGSGLDSSEIDSANNLASFFNINIIKQDSDYVSINDVENAFIIGNSNKNSLSQEVLGNWNYSSGEAIARFIANQSSVKIILAGSDSADTINIINSIIEKTAYYEGFTEDCVVVDSCEYVCYPGDLNCDGFITGRELFEYLAQYSNQEVLSLNLYLAVEKWINQN